MERIALSYPLSAPVLILTILLFPVLSRNSNSFSHPEEESQSILDLDDFATWFLDGSTETYGLDNDFPFTRITEGHLEPTVREVSEPEVDTDDYQNPGVYPFRSFLERRIPDNPLGRDTDEYLQYVDKTGQDHNTGKTSWLLVSSFNPNVTGSGKVWALPSMKFTAGFALIGGLETPTGICFDANHDFLYVCDPGQGAIFQYEINRRGPHSFELRSDVVATIVEHGAPQDCSIDASGNLYYVDTLNNTIGTVDFSSLWSGYINCDRVFLNDTNRVSGPVAIDVHDSETLYYLNTLDPCDSGLLDSVEIASMRVISEVREEKKVSGLAVSKKNAYFSSADGTVLTR